MSVSHLFVPADSQRKIEKALAGSSDVVILDLEDGVAPQNKASARKLICSTLKEHSQSKSSGLTIWVRCNSVDSPFFFDDSALIREVPPKGILVAKCESPEQVREVSALAPASDLIPLLESAKGISRLEAIVKGGGKIQRVAFGSVDFALDIGGDWTPEGEERKFAMGQIVFLSRVAGLKPPIDAVFPQIDDPEAFHSDVKFGRNLGFYGKMVIHPRQVDWLRKIYEPSAAEIAWAMRVVDSFEQSQGGAVLLDGKLIDLPIAERANRILKNAECLPSLKHQSILNNLAEGG